MGRTINKSIIQINAMKTRFPNFRYREKGDSVIFTGDLFVREDIPIYKVSIEYRGNLRPIVKVLSPVIDEDAPHVYDDGSLCLYHPDQYNWNASKLLIKDIIPWTAAWIYFYEYWLQTGQWLGPEAPHTNKMKKNDE